MTAKTDQLAVDSARAAALVKSTAEQTATALNIQYIQRDISEMKGAIDKLAAAQDGKIETLETKVEALTRTVAIGIGIATTIAFSFPILIKILYK